MRSQIQNARKQKERPKKFSKAIDKEVKGRNAGLIMQLGVLKFPVRTMVVPLTGSYVLLLTPASGTEAAKLELAYPQERGRSYVTIDSGFEAVRKGALTPQMLTKALRHHVELLASGQRTIVNYSVSKFDIQR